MSKEKPVITEKHLGLGIDAILVWESNPIPAIQRAIDKSDWFQAIVLSATQIERFGYYAILDFFESLKPDEKKVLAGIIEPLYLTQIAQSLQTIGKITPKERKIIMKINDERNSFVHQREIPKFTREREKAKAKYLPLVEKAMTILRDRLSAEEKRLP